MKKILVGLSFILYCGMGIYMVQAKEVTEAPLTPEEQAEMDHRHKCEFDICKIFASKKMDGPDISCDIAKTVRKQKIEQKYLAGKLSWPWGNARCQTQLSLKREMLVKAMTVDGYEFKLPKQSLACQMSKQDGKGKYELNLSVTPIVVWKNGKADKVTLNISDISGAALAKGGLWTIAKANSYFGILDGPVKDKLNEFVTNSCKDLLAHPPK